MSASADGHAPRERVRSLVFSASLREDSLNTKLARLAAAASRALLSDRAEAEELHREAVDQLRRSRLVVLHARAQLSYGEWLRREIARPSTTGRVRIAGH